jgi:hypothetical protein
MSKKTHRCSVCGFEIDIKEGLSEKGFDQVGSTHPHTNGMRQCYGRIWEPLKKEKGRC